MKQANDESMTEALRKASECLSQIGRSMSVTAESLQMASDSLAELGKAIEPYSQEELDMRFKRKRRRWWIALIVLVICVAAVWLLL